ncbi:MAG: hypothetical protein ACLVJ6_09025 [Merdibacter sp.]
MDNAEKKVFHFTCPCRRFSSMPFPPQRFEVLSNLIDNALKPQRALLTTRRFDAAQCGWIR